MINTIMLVKNIATQNLNILLTFPKITFLKTNIFLCIYILIIVLFKLVPEFYTTNGKFEFLKKLPF